jgi:hypothetical protein
MPVHHRQPIEPMKAIINSRQWRLLALPIARPMIQ